MLLLKQRLPELKNVKGEHYADLLERFFQAKLAKSPHSESAPPPRVTGVAPFPLKPSRIGKSRIDKASLAIPTARRLRDKDHLRHVGTLPCLVCQATPSHAHHLTFAQRRGMSLKVSDEFVVPLCVLHHNEVHRSGSEALWWKRANLEPLAIARELWEKRSHAANGQAGRPNGAPDVAADALTPPDC
jgi:hypothetical protein